MNRILFCVALVLFSGVVNAQEAFAPTIHRGIWGRITYAEGDCMPGAKPPECKRTGSSRRVYVLEPVASRDVDMTRLEIPGVIVNDTISGPDGYFEVEVPPGVYSVFVGNEGKKYCNIFGQEHDQVCQVTVESVPVQFNMDVNDAMWE